MRAGVIFDFVKEDWYSYRRLLFWYVLITLVLVVQAIGLSKAGLLANWIGYFSEGDVYVGVAVMSFVAILLPFTFSWIVMVTRVSWEEQAGFFSFLKILPVSAKEIVTSQYIFWFSFQVFINGWLCMLWWLFTVNYSHEIPYEIWAALFMPFCVFPIWFALHLVVFFRWGGSNASLVFAIGILFIFLGRINGFEEWVQRFILFMEAYPVRTWGPAILIAIFVWVIGWRLSMKGYEKRLHNERK